jgi:SAM-dependent methyltransferase
MDISESARNAGWLHYAAEVWEQRKPVTWLPDWEFWQWCARQYAGNDPILELACGNGRITRQLALSEYSVVAVDINPHFLNCAANHLPAPIRDHVEFVLQDVVQLQLPQVFSLALMADWAFPAILTLEDLLTLFQHLAACLKPKGVFALNTLYPTERQQGLQSSPGSSLLKWPGEERYYDPISQVETKRSDVYQIRLRHTTLSEIRLLGGQTGFEVIELFGGTDRRAFRGLPGDDLTLVLRKTL